MFYLELSGVWFIHQFIWPFDLKKVSGTQNHKKSLPAKIQINR